MDKFTHWLFDLNTFPRLLMLAVVFGSLSGALLYALRGSAPPALVNVVQESSCDRTVVSVDPSSACTSPVTYHDFRYVCGSGAEGYLGAEEPHCLTLAQATQEIMTYCAAACLTP